MNLLTLHANGTQEQVASFPKPLFLFKFIRAWNKSRTEPNFIETQLEEMARFDAAQRVASTRVVPTPTLPPPPPKPTIRAQRSPSPPIRIVRGPSPSPEITPPPPNPTQKLAAHHPPPRPLPVASGSKPRKVEVVVPPTTKFHLLDDDDDDAYSPSPSPPPKPQKQMGKSRSKGGLRTIEVFRKACE